jgi:formate-dependent nitrite reductase cytochrome c552 subunit
MGTKIKYHLQKRMFLNRYLDKPAMIMASVEDTRAIPQGDGQVSGDIEFSISDCYNRVSLNFYLGNPEDRANSLYKIRRIAAIVNEFHKALEIEAESISKRKIPKKVEENTG